MGEFTVDLKRIDFSDIGDKSLVKLAQGWAGNLEILERGLDDLDKDFDAFEKTAKEVTRACESRLKEEVSPEEQKQLEALLDYAIEMRKKINAIDLL